MNLTGHMLAIECLSILFSSPLHKPEKYSFNNLLCIFDELSPFPIEKLKQKSPASIPYIPTRPT
jgi:hypothetical protein